MLRNLGAWSFCLVAFCVSDYFHVRHGPQAMMWGEPLMLPLFFGAILFANQGLFAGIESSGVRWFAIGVVSLMIALVSGYVLIVLGMSFHFFIGGNL